MSQDAVGSDVVAICLSRDELSKKGFSDSLSAVSAKRLILEALKDKGEELWDDMEVEVFTCEDALLVMARPAWNEYHSFYFKSIDNIILSLESTDREFPSSLFYFQGEYILCLRAGEDELPSAFFEYGDHIKHRTEFLAHLCEHGESIIPQDAFSVLRSAFR